MLTGFWNGANVFEHYWPCTLIFLFLVLISTPVMILHQIGPNPQWLLTKHKHICSERGEWEESLWEGQKGTLKERLIAVGLCTVSQIWKVLRAEFGISFSLCLALFNSVSHTHTHICLGSLLVTWLWVSDIHFFALSHKAYTITHKPIWKKNHKGHLYLISFS